MGLGLRLCWVGKITCFCDSFRFVQEDRRPSPFRMEFMVFLLFVSSFGPVIGDTCQRNPNALFRTEGDVILVGLFDTRSGVQCDIRKRGGEQQMYAASTVIDWLNNATYTNGLNIGFLALDTCLESETAIKHLIYGLMETGYINSCGIQRLLGFVGPSNDHISSEISEFLKALSIPYLPINIENIEAEIQALVAILVRFDWRRVAVLSVNQQLNDHFHKRAAKSDVCITVSGVLNDSRDEYEDFFLRMAETSITVVVILSTEYELIKSIQTASYTTEGGLYWLAAGMTSRNIDLELEKFKHVIKSLIIAESSELSTNSDLSSKIEDAMKDNKRCMIEDCRNDLLDVGVRETISDVLRYSLALKELQEDECPPTEKMCLSLSRELSGLVSMRLMESSEEVTKVTSLFVTTNISLWSYQEEKRKTKMAHFHQVGHFAENELKINTKKLDILQPMGGGWFKIPHFLCEGECSCLNFREAQPIGLIRAKPDGIWRTETWVTVCVTISSIGIMVSLSIFIFILYQICSEEMVEGHHGFSLLILLGVILLYSATFPYALFPSEIVCAFRMGLLGLGYAAVFSPMVARCLMLATSGPLGFAGHINGTVQTALYCFVFSVQIALTVQYWWLNWGQHVSAKSQEALNCPFNTTVTVTSLIYNMILLAFLLFLSPFCIKSRRNHREGLFFHLSSLATFIVWITWVTLYLLFSSEWAELLLCVGFVATATSVLVIVFLPRVYRIATASSRHGSKIGLRSLDRLTSSTRTNSTNRNLYSSVKNTYGAEPVIQPLKDETESEVYEDGTLPTITHL